MTKHKATDATPRHNHATAMRLLANGDATMAEVARLAGVSRQAVAKWAKAAGIDPVAARKARLERLWHDERQALIAAAQPPQSLGQDLIQAAKEGIAIARGRPLPKRKRPK